MLTHVFSNFQVPKILRKKKYAKKSDFPLSEMPAFVTINKHIHNESNKQFLSQSNK